MKAISEMKTAATRPGLVLKRQRESLEKIKARNRQQAAALGALRGAVRDLQASRDRWKQKCEEAAHNEAKLNEENERLRREVEELKKN